MDDTLNAWWPILVNMAIIAGLVSTIIHQWEAKLTPRLLTGVSFLLGGGLGALANSVGVLTLAVKGWHGLLVATAIGLLSAAVGAGFSPLNILQSVKRQ